MLRGDTVNTYLIVFGLIWSVLEPTSYRTWDENAKYYTIDADLGYYEKDFDV